MAVKRGEPGYRKIAYHMARQGRQADPDGHGDQSDQTNSKRSAAAVAAKLREMAKAQGVEGDHRPTKEQVEKFLNLTHDELNMITLIGSGFPVRGSQTILSAIKVKLDKTVAPAGAASDAKAPITVVVNTLGPATAQVSVDLPKEEDSIQ